MQIKEFEFKKLIEIFLLSAIIFFRFNLKNEMKGNLRENYRSASQFHIIP